MWKTTNALGEDIILYSEDEVKNKFNNIKNICQGAIFQTCEANKLKDEILRIINEVQNEI